MKSVDEIKHWTDLSQISPELTDAEREVMAGETVPVVLAFKAKLEAMTDEEFRQKTSFPQIKAVQKKQVLKGKTSSCQLLYQVEMHDQN